MAIAKITGFFDAKEELRQRGFDFADSTYHRAVEIICGFDAAMDELHDLAVNGPHVPYRLEIIPLAQSKLSKAKRKQK